MGIPSYFSHIAKNHTDIIQKLCKFGKNIDNLYLDSNSIIYDCLRAISTEYEKCANDQEFECKLHLAVCKKIDEYIFHLKPSKKVFIAFDGVAPVAKLEQQRNRRYKSNLFSEIRKHLGEENTGWNKTAITPGTKFMTDLNTFIKNYYRNQEKKYQINEFIISGSDECGEGEHKLFQYIRDNSSYHHSTVTVIYGLDADLIMLCINHLPISKQIYLYRETPEFAKSLNRDLEPNQSYLMHIPSLANTIVLEMNGQRAPNSKQQRNRLYDYIFLCFFLGNDFLPHFPSVNIRNGGIHIMMSAYQNTIGKTNNNLTDGKKIYWKYVRKMVEYLADQEYSNLMSEYKIRERGEKRYIKAVTIDEKMNKLLTIPQKNRELEKFIDPRSKYWENRYYKALFGIDITNQWKQKICVNYLEGLEWTISYYTDKCKDWRWCYHYNYPPLFSDLVKFIPHWETIMIEKNSHKAVSPYVQLSYVLPKSSLTLLPNNIKNGLLEHYSELYDDDCKIFWAFCKYLWEGHVEFPHINLDDLENFVTTIKV